MGTRLAATVVAVGLLAGCGSVDERSAGETSGVTDATEELLPAPPIEGIDEPAPRGALQLVSTPTSQAQDWAMDGRGNCVRVTYEIEGSPPLSESRCPQDALEQILGEEAKALPAAEPRARAVARLRLEDGGAFYVVEYQSRGRGTCAFVLGADEAGVLNGGATGSTPCASGGDQFCTELCVVPALVSPADDRIVLAGTVPAAADSIRIAFADGYVARYPLVGPLLSTERDQRIFMVEQFHGIHARIDLLRGDELVASEAQPPIDDAGVIPPELDQTPGTQIELEGRKLHVAIGPDAPPEAQALLGEERLLFLCGGSEDDLEGPEPPPALAYGRFPPGQREVTMELAADVSGTLLMCGAGQPDGTGDGVYKLFVSYDELDKLVPESVYQQDTDAEFRLDGRRLTVRIGPDAAPETELLLNRELTFLCGTEDELGPSGASALAEGRFPPGEREVTVTLSADPGPAVFFCGVEAKDGSTEIFSFDVGG